MLQQKIIADPQHHNPRHDARDGPLEDLHHTSRDAYGFFFFHARFYFAMHVQ